MNTNEEIFLDCLVKQTEEVGLDPDHDGGQREEWEAVIRKICAEAGLPADFVEKQLS